MLIIMALFLFYRLFSMGILGRLFQMATQGAVVDGDVPGLDEMGGGFGGGGGGDDGLDVPPLEQDALDFDDDEF